jgi:hypothetical protein
LLLLYECVCVVHHQVDRGHCHFAAAVFKGGPQALHACEASSVIASTAATIALAQRRHDLCAD